MEEKELITQILLAVENNEQLADRINKLTFPFTTKYKNWEQ